MKLQRMFSGSTLFKKLFFLLIVSVYIPLLLVGYMTYSKSSEQIENMTAAFLSDNLAYNKSRIQEYIDEVEQQSVAVYASEKLQHLLSQSKIGNIADYEYLNQFSLLSYELSNSYYLSVYPETKDDFLNYNVLRANSPIRNSEWFQQALKLQGAGFWMNEINSDFSGIRSDFFYIRAIRSLNVPLFENVGVMTIRVPSKHLGERLLLLERYPNHQISILDDHNVNLLDPQINDDEHKEWVSSNLSLNETEFRVVRGPEEEYYVASTGIGSDWRLVATIPTSDVNGPILQLREFTWFILIISLSLIAVLLAFITNSFTVPIQIVVGHMKKLNLGILEYCSSFVNRRDEIGQLVTGYNRMIQGMHELLETTKTTEQEKRKLEIQMLMHQINPHFLYNTLDSIKWRAEVAGEKSIAEMSTLLANLLRFSLNDGEEMTTVEREIEHVKCYLTIEQLRSNGAFQVIYNVHPDVYNAPFMKLTIQPIVENSVRHGMKKLAPGVGKLFLSIYPDGDDIVCSVEDNGPGCTDELLEALNQLQFERQGSRASGIGLNNVSGRLKANFGSKYGLRFERSSSSGLWVTIRQPLKDQHDNNPL